MLVSLSVCTHLLCYRCIAHACRTEWVQISLIREAGGLEKIPTEGAVLGCPLLSISLTFTDFHLFLAGGHEDFSKMIDEAEPLGYPVVVKSTRGHQGQCCSWASFRAAALPIRPPSGLQKHCWEEQSSPWRRFPCSPDLPPLLTVPILPTLPWTMVAEP